jgi:hypothetical protein
LGLGILFWIGTLLPIVYWNSQHDWISFRFHLTDRFSREPSTFNILGVLLVFVISVATMCPTFGLPMWWVSGQTLGQQISAFVSGKRGEKRDDRSLKQWLILCVSLPLILGFSYLGGYHHLAPSWILPGFWSCTILLGDRAVYWQTYSRQGVRRWLVGSGIAIVTLLSLALLHLNLGTFQKPSQYALFGGIIAPTQDPSREIVDISQLRQGFADSPEWLDMALYPLVPIPVTSFNRDPRGFKVWLNSADWIGKDGLLITTNDFAGRPEEIDRYRPYFQVIEKVGVIPIQRGGVAIEQFHVYKATRLLKAYP